MFNRLLDLSGFAFQTGGQPDHPVWGGECGRADYPDSDLCFDPQTDGGADGSSILPDFFRSPNSIGRKSFPGDRSGDCDVLELLRQPILDI